MRRCFGDFPRRARVDGWFIRVAEVSAGDGQEGDRRSPWSGADREADQQEGSAPGDDEPDADPQRASSPRCCNEIRRTDPAARAVAEYQPGHRLVREVQVRSRESMRSLEL